MPQLDPAPWFNILALCWVVFLTIIVPKMLNRTTPNDPAPQSTQALKTEPWSWQ